MKTGLTISSILLMYGYCYSQSPQAERLILNGNGFYKKQQFDQATRQYEKAIEADPSNSTAIFNLGNSLYKKNSRNEAIKTYAELAAKTKDISLKSNSYFNEGVVLGKQQKLEQSIETYKNALRQNPENTEARENLQKALLELKKRNTPPKQEPEKKKQQQQQKQQQTKMNQKEAEQRLKLMEQKEKEVQQRLQKEKSKTGGGQTKDW